MNLPRAFYPKAFLFANDGRSYDFSPFRKAFPSKFLDSGSRFSGNPGHNGLRFTAAGTVDDFHIIPYYGIPAKQACTPTIEAKIEQSSWKMINNLLILSSLRPKYDLHEMKLRLSLASILTIILLAFLGTGSTSCSSKSYSSNQCIEYNRNARIKAYKSPTNRGSYTHNKSSRKKYVIKK